jgi:DNA-binding beta-propeller fold protein YncE
LSPDGKALMVIGKEGVSGNGPDAFDRPTGVAVAPNGDVFAADGHSPNQHNSARVVKFSKDGRFIKTWGHKGAAPGDFDEPHDIFIGGSQGHVFVADRRNNRVQVFDQDGNFIDAWTQSVSRVLCLWAKTTPFTWEVHSPIRQQKKAS